jgi:hypothetical protein
MGADQKGCEFGHGRVVGLGIGHIGVELDVRRILSIVSAVELSEGQEQTLRVRIRIACFFVAMRTSMISWATSVMCYINVQSRFVEVHTAGAACDYDSDHVQWYSGFVREAGRRMVRMGWCYGL